MSIFNEEKDEMLIKLVKAKPMIYDSKHPQHRNLIAKYTEWTDISNNMKLPVVDIQKRWKHFRDHYKKKKKLPSKKNKWRYMHLLEFLSVPSKVSQLDSSITRKTEQQMAMSSEMTVDEMSDVSLLSEYEELEATPPPAHPDTSLPETSSNFPNNLTRPNTPRPDGFFTVAGPSSLSSIRKKRKAETESTASIRPVSHEFSKDVTPKEFPTTPQSDDSLQNFDQSVDEEIAAFGATKHVLSQQSVIHKYFEAVAEIVSMFPPHLISDAKLKIHKSIYKIELECQNRASPAVD